jgi:hypothetical protein
MAIFYCDLVNGNDANNGTTWALSKLTMTAAVNLCAAGDTVRVAKGNDKSSIGNATWTQGPMPATKAIVSSTNASPIQVTVTSHGYATGDVVQITGHTVNSAANGVWIVTNTGANTFTLDGSTGNGVGGASGTAANINAKTIKLASALTTTVNNAETAWTAANSYTTSQTTTQQKQGFAALQVNSPASPTNNKAVYFTLPATLDLSAYNSLTFWIRAQAGVIVNGSWSVRLCSDTIGATTVDTFTIPAVGTTGVWIPVTIARTGGGSLGSAIASIAIYGSTSVTASSNILADNFSACNAASLNLNSVLSPVSSNTDVNDNYTIQSIDSTLVIIDNGINDIATVGRGYYSSSASAGSITTYLRNPITPLTVSSTNLAGTLLCNATPTGTAVSYINVIGGWNTSSTTVDSITVVNLNNTAGIASRSFFSWQGFGLVRGNNNNYNLQNVHGPANFTGCFSTGSSSAPGFTLGGQSLGTISNPGNILITNCCSNNHALLGFAIGGIPTTVIGCVGKNNQSNSSATLGGGLSAAGVSNFIDCEADNNYGAGFFIQGASPTYTNCKARSNGNFNSTTGAAIEATFASTAWFYNLTTSGNNNRVFSAVTSPTAFYFFNLNFSEASLSTNTFATNPGYVYQQNTNGSSVAAINSVGTSITQDATTTNGTAPFSWKTSFSNACRNSQFPTQFLLASVYLTANVPVTISVWSKKDNTTGVVNQLVIPAYQINGITTDQIATGTATVSFEQLSLTITPTASGVVNVYGRSYLTGATTSYNTWFTNLSLPAGLNNANLGQSLLGQPYAQNNAGAVAYAAVGL